MNSNGLEIDNSDDKQIGRSGLLEYPGLRPELSALVSTEVGSLTSGHLS